MCKCFHMNYTKTAATCVHVTTVLCLFDKFLIITFVIMLLYL